MSGIFLNNLLIVYLFSEAILLILSIYLLFLDIKLIKYWDFNSFTSRQFKLEKSGFLLSTIAKFLFTFKFILLIYFVYMIDSLSSLIPGAMCAAGVISANSYGLNLLLVKLLTLFALMLFLTLDFLDLQAKTYPLFKVKLWVILIALFLIFLEGYLDFKYFSNIDISQSVSCCSSLYGNLEGANPLPFNLNIKMLLILFYTLFIALLSSLLLENKILTAVLILLFAVISYYSVVYFFGTYIYELPSHKCPFCMMQKEYYYIGYLLWGFLGGSLFFGLIWAIIGFLNYKLEKLKKLSIIFLIGFVFLCSFYVLIYYIKNGVFL